MRIAAVLFIICLSLPAQAHSEESQPAPYAGSSSCRECHEKFYQLWSTSMHGLAMQPYSAGFAKEKLTPYQGDITIGRKKYHSDINEGVMIETSQKGTKKYKIEHVLGGKNVYYFLTPFTRGRLQTLPVAYDVNKKEWFDTAASGMRHFPGGERGETVNWKESPYTFNTACYSCHVSQLSTNYDLKTDTYHTTWAEPGINCETCHGPSGEHNKIAKATPKGQPLPEYKLIRTKTMTKEQRNDLCSSCHAKGSPLTPEYTSGERFFDHFDLATLEDADFYPDGRDLGENYTLTSWKMSPCAKSGKLDWSKLPEMLDYVRDAKHDEVFATSLLRLIPPSQDQRVLAALLSASTDSSPLVRAAAVQALGLVPTTESLQTLIEATGDEYRLVRVRAAAGIAAFTRMTAPAAYQDQLKKANREYLASITARPDQWTSHYNMGNYQLSRGEPKKAVDSYQSALNLEPQAIMPMVNSSIAYARMGDTGKAEKSLQQALRIAPDNAAANFNMGLVKAEKNEPKQAEKHLNKAIKADPQMAQAAFNLCIITAKDRINEAVTWCRKAAELRPQDPNYAYTLAFYLNKKGDRDESVRTLKTILATYPQYKDGEMLLKEIAK